MAVPNLKERRPAHTPCRTDRAPHPWCIFLSLVLFSLFCLACTPTPDATPTPRAFQCQPAPMKNDLVDARVRVISSMLFLSRLSFSPLCDAPQCQFQCQSKPQNPCAPINLPWQPRLRATCCRACMHMHTIFREGCIIERFHGRSSGWQPGAGEASHPSGFGTTRPGLGSNSPTSQAQPTWQLHV